MSRRKYQLLSVLLILSVLLVGCGKGKEETPTSTTVAGNFEMEVEDVKERPDEVEPATETETIHIDLDGEYFYDVEIPKGVDYVTDYSKSIYGKEPSFTLQVLSGVTDSSFSYVTGISNAETVTKNCVRTKVGVRGPQESAILLQNGRALVLRCYNAPEVFATVLSSFTNENNVPYKVDNIKWVDPVKHITQLSYSGSYKPTAINKADIGTTCLYKFDTGCLYAMKELEKFDKCKDFMLKKLNVVSGYPIEETFSYQNIYYAKAGDFYMALYGENYNTTVVIFGNGEEAMCNIIFLLNQLL